MAHSYGIARCRDATGNFYCRRSIEQTPQPFVKPLRCAGRGCNAAVTAVRRHLRGTTEIDSLFRLAQSETHAPGCPFDVVRQLENIHKLATVDKDGDTFRLNLETFQRPAPIKQPLLEKPADPRTPAGLASDPTRRVDPVLSAARDIARLIQASGDDSDLIDRFQARLNDGTTLTWRQFCWPAHLVEQLTADIAANPHRPRAVYGPLDPHVPTRTIQRTTTSKMLQLDTSSSPASSTKVRIRTKNLTLADALTRPGAFVLGLSQSWGPYPSPAEHAGAPTEIRMWVDDPRWVTSWIPS